MIEAVRPGPLSVQPRRAAGTPPAWLTIAGGMLVAAFALRLVNIGNPIFGLDEQYYLLVGDQLLHGQLPYVDLWDRKPFGLFALFALIRLLSPGDGVVGAQVAATLASAATATVVVAIADGRTGRAAAVMAGLLYLAALPLLWGGSTQSPVFYNLPVALAAWLATRIDAGRAGSPWRTMAPVLLLGLAVQLKTTALFEGAAIGGWLAWRILVLRGPRVAARFLLLAAPVAVLPTALIALGYLLAGHGDAWWFANVVSLTRKSGGLGPVALIRLHETVMLVTPLAALALLGLVRSPLDPRTLLLAGWAASALLGAAAIGGFWVHYALPFAVPAAILAAAVFDRRAGWLWFAASTAFPVYYAIVMLAPVGRYERSLAQTTLQALPADVGTRCLFIYEGPVIYYHLSHACRVTPYAFGDHLRSSLEAEALPDRAADALRQALARRPGTIMTVANSLWTERNLTDDAILTDELARHYRPVARLPHRFNSRGHEWLMIWRRDG